jgi:hypothetical protein
MEPNNTKPISSLAAAAAKAKTANSNNSNTRSSTSLPSSPNSSSNSSKPSSLQHEYHKMKQSSKSDRFSQSTVVAHTPMKSKNERSNQHRHSNGRKTSGSSGGGAGRGSGCGNLNRGKNGGRGHYLGRGGVTQQNRQHKHHKDEYDSHGITRTDSGTIQFEYEIDFDDDCDGNDNNDTHAVQSPNPKSSRKNKHHDERRRLSGNNKNHSSGGRILDVRASTRLIDHALGRRRSHDNNKVRNDSKNAHFLGRNNSDHKEQQYQHQQQQQQKDSKNHFVSKFDNIRNHNANDSRQNSDQNEPTIETPKKIILLPKATGETPTSSTKIPMKRWADHEDGDY